MNKASVEYKVKWYDAANELLQLGFDMDKNSARAFIAGTNEILKIKEEEVLNKN